MMNLVSFMLTFLKVIWVYTGFEYKFSIINLPKNLQIFTELFQIFRNSYLILWKNKIKMLS